MRPHPIAALCANHVGFSVSAPYRDGLDESGPEFFDVMDGDGMTIIHCTSEEAAQHIADALNFLGLSVPEATA